MNKLFLTLIIIVSISPSIYSQNQLPVSKKFQLQKLPYQTDALAPKISKQTMELHWGKHVKTYIDNVNKLILGTSLEDQSLEDIIKQTSGPLYNNAAQVWNHNLFFAIMSPNPQKMPTGALLEEINKTFGSFEKLKEEFIKAGTSLFGSGWVWLIKEKNGRLTILQTPNGNCPIKENVIPLMNCDVWEHAYYLDYQNKRTDYINAFWDLIDWNVVGKRFE